MIYLDNAATTFTSYNVAEALAEWNSKVYGNPSSIHTLGRESLKKINNARLAVADLISADDNEIVFTSGGTESNNLAIQGMIPYLQDNYKCVLVGSTEHSSVLNTCKNLVKYGISVIEIPVDNNGLIDYVWLLNYIRSYNVGLISIMAVNNETGVIQDINKIGRLCRDNNIFYHCDAVQAVGHIPIDVKNDCISLLSMSGHKIHACQGVGALYVNGNVPLSPLLFGGGQEHGLRSGTENVGGIISLGIAADDCKNCLNDDMKCITSLRDIFLSELSMCVPYELTVYIRNNNVIPNIVSFRVPNISGETMMLFLDALNIYVSAGSACNSGNPAPSHVLKAMSISDSKAKETVRVSFSRYNTISDVVAAVKGIEMAYNTLNVRRNVV